jgi:hypothetical protein
MSYLGFRARHRILEPGIRVAWPVWDGMNAPTVVARMTAMMRDNVCPL